MTDTSERDAQTEALAAVIRGRRSINFFEPDPVETGLLLDAIEVARWAPNHRLTEPWRFYLLGPQTKDAVVECWAGFEAETKGERAGQARRERLAGIPGHFVLTSLKSADALVDRENYAACCCAAQNLMLYLWQCGIGTKWTTGGITREQRLYDVLGIDSSAEALVGYFWYGKAKVVTPQRRTDVGEIAKELP